MKLRDKFLYMSFGAGLVVLGMVLNSLISDADAGKGSIDAKFGKVTCQELEVLGKSKFLSIEAFSIKVFILRGQDVVITDENGGWRGFFGLDSSRDAMMKIYGDDGNTTVAYLGRNPKADGEMMFFLKSKSKTDKREVSMQIDENGGRFDAENKMGEDVVRLAVGDDGSGGLDVRDKHGYKR